MQGLSDYLASRVMDTPLIWNIRVLNVTADSNDILERGGQTSFSIPLDENGASGVQLQFEISESYMDEALRNLLLTFLSTVIVMLVAIAEINRLPEILLDKRAVDAGNAAAGKRPVLPSALRLVTFLVYMGNYVCIPYTGALIRARGIALPGLSMEMTATLPITVETVAMMLGMIVLNKVGYKLKNSLSLLGTGAMLIACNLLCIIPGSAFYLIAMRALCGLGYALLRTTLNRFATFGEGADLGVNIAAINAGVLGGIMCGGSLGAIVSNVISPYATYACTAFFALIFVIMSRSIISHDALSGKGEKTSTEGGFFKLLRSRRVVFYLICVLVPLNIGLMFIVAFFPSFLASSGNELLTSYGYIVNGLAGIYAGPYLVRTLGKKLGYRKSLAFLMLMGAAAIAILGFDSILVVTAMISAALMGVFAEFGNPIVSDYFLSLPEVQSIGASNALGYTTVIGSAAQAVSPVLYGMLITMMGNTGSMGALLPISLVCVLAGVLILLFLRENKGTDIQAEL